MEDFEGFATSHFRAPGTFVYVIRVDSNKAEFDSTARILGKMGVFALSQEKSLKEIVRQGRNAKLLLDHLPGPLDAQG